MTLADVLKASIVPELGMFDSAIGQSKTRITSLKQQVENTKLDMQDLEKRLAAEEKKLAELMAKAEAADEKTKMMEAKKMEAKKMEKKKMEGSGGKTVEGSLKK